jgi:hypothetical protein
MVLRLALLVVTVLMVIALFSRLMAIFMWTLEPLLLGFAAGFLTACVLLVKLK